MPYSAAAGHARDSSALSIQHKASKSKITLYLKLHEIIILLMDFAEMSLGQDVHSPPTYSYFLQVHLEMPVIQVVLYSFLPSFPNEPQYTFPTHDVQISRVTKQ